MVYREVGELTVLEVREEHISFSRIVDAVLSKPSNVIYCQARGKLCGVISMGDVARAYQEGRDEVPVNKCFTYVLSGECMKARSIFSRKENINAIPVVDGEGVLLGDYARWDDLLFEGHMLDVEKEQISFARGEGYIALVRPHDSFVKKQSVFHRLYQHLTAQGVEVKCINYLDIESDVDNAKWVLFVDEDELRAIDTLYLTVWKKRKERTRLTTYRRLMVESGHEMLNGYLRWLDENGVRVLRVFFSDTKQYQIFEEKVKNKFAALGKKVSNKMPVEMYSQFFADLYTRGYAEHVLHIPHSVETKSGTGKLKDFHGRYYNVTNGERHTAGQPEEFEKSIYFFGPCFIYGYYVEDKNTIESILQKRLNQSRHAIRGVNCGGVYSMRVSQEQARIMDTPLRRGDSIVLFSDNKKLGKKFDLDLSRVLEHHDIDAAWVVDDLMHCNHKVNALYAEEIFKALKPSLAEKANTDRVGQGELIEKNEDFVKAIYINRYFRDFDVSTHGKIGSIVMNCNPFTYGHRYLIEQALKMVDFLIVFVVEEDKSVFSFAERFAMVCEGTADLENVKVIPSGAFILSQTTFPEYFIKEADEDIAENVENDITFFAERIAPHLNIHYRFVGEEPDDVVTNEYNSAMKRILPKKGIELIEIPRKERDGKCISASRVRRCLEEDDMEEIKELVPESTRRILLGEV